MVFINRDSILQMVNYVLTGDDARPGEAEMIEQQEEFDEEELLETELVA